MTSHTVRCTKFFSSLTGISTTCARVQTMNMQCVRRLAFCFPWAVLVSCCWHLRTSTLTYCKDVVVMSQSMCFTFMQAIFMANQHIIGYLGQQSHKNMLTVDVTEWVSSFLTAHQHNKAIQCHSSCLVSKRKYHLGQNAIGLSAVTVTPAMHLCSSGWCLFITHQTVRRTSLTSCVMFIHDQSDTEMYNKFFSSLATCMQTMNFHQLCLVRLLAFCFLGAVLVSCRWHLRTNTLTYVKDVVDMSQSMCSSFVQAIFNDNSLTSHTDMTTVECSLEWYAVVSSATYLTRCEATLTTDSKVAHTPDSGSSIQ